MRNNAVGSVRAFNRFYTNVIGVVDRHILDSDYSLLDARILYEVDSTPGVTAREVKARLSVNEGHLSHVLDQLCKKELLRRTRSPDDKRAYHLTLTEKGRAEFAKLNQRSDHAIAALLQGLDEAGSARLLEAMGTIRSILASSEVGRA
jgi:DNA-binding MarR family transcriptional regulator